MKPTTDFMSALMCRMGPAMKIQRVLNLAVAITDGVMTGTALVKKAIASGALDLQKIHDSPTGEDIVYLGKPKAAFEILREVEDWVPDALTSAYQVRVLNTLQGVKFKINPKVLIFIQANRAYWRVRVSADREEDRIKTTMGCVAEFLKKHPDGVFVQKYASPDGRRYYALSNPLTHQGADHQRGLVRFAKARPIKTKTALAQFFKEIEDEYGVNQENYHLVCEDPTRAFTCEHGLKGKKPCCTYDAALAIEELKQNGLTSYIHQKDQTCSGFQHFAMELGCRALALTTNLLGGPKQDLYTVSSQMARMFVPHPAEYEYFLNRGKSKFFVLRLGYGSSSKSLARGLILAKPQDDEFSYTNSDGNYLEGSLETLARSRFNDENYSHFVEMPGWDAAVKSSSVISKSYYSGLMRFSPKLQAALSMFKAAHCEAEKQGKFMSWTLPNGDVKTNVAWRPVSTAKLVRVGMKDLQGKPFQFSMMPMERKSAASAVAPTFIHSADGLTLGEIILESAEKYGENIAPIHDSVGCSVSHFDRVPGMWSTVATRLWLTREQSMFFETMAKYNITVSKSVWPKGWQALDLCNARHHLT